MSGKLYRNPIYPLFLLMPNCLAIFATDGAEYISPITVSDVTFASTQSSHEYSCTRTHTLVPHTQLLYTTHTRMRTHPSHTIFRHTHTRTSHTTLTHTCTHPVRMVDKLQSSMYTTGRTTWPLSRYPLGIIGTPGILSLPLSRIGTPWVSSLPLGIILTPGYNRYPRGIILSPGYNRYSLGIILTPEYNQYP